MLVLANERDVRSRASFRNDPIQLQATTGRSWLSQLHRHVAGRDDCVRCRMSDIRTPQFGCSEAAMATAVQPDNPDAALPFLSGASGLMLVSALQRLQLGQFGRDRSNVWNWDFRSTRRIDSPPGYYECRDAVPQRCHWKLVKVSQPRPAGPVRHGWLQNERSKCVGVWSVQCRPRFQTRAMSCLSNKASWPQFTLDGPPALGDWHSSFAVRLQSLLVLRRRGMQVSGERIHPNIASMSPLAPVETYSLQQVAHSDKIIRGNNWTYRMDSPL